MLEGLVILGALVIGLALVLASKHYKVKRLETDNLLLQNDVEFLTERNGLELKKVSDLQLKVRQFEKSYEDSQKDYTSYFNLFHEKNKKLQELTVTVISLKTENSNCRNENTKVKEDFNRLKKISENLNVVNLELINKEEEQTERIKDLDNRNIELFNENILLKKNNDLAEQSYNSAINILTNSRNKLENEKIQNEKNTKLLVESTNSVFDKLKEEKELAEKKFNNLIEDYNKLETTYNTCLSTLQGVQQELVDAENAIRNHDMVITPTIKEGSVKQQVPSKRKRKN